MLISHFSKAKSNTRFSCCTTVTPVSRYRGQRFISEIRTESTLPTFYVTHSETCNLLLPCHAFRDMYPVLPCLGIRDIYHRPLLFCMVSLLLYQFLRTLFWSLLRINRSCGVTHNVDLVYNWQSRVEEQGTILTLQLDQDLDLQEWWYQQGRGRP